MKIEEVSKAKLEEYDESLFLDNLGLCLWVLELLRKSGKQTFTSHEIVSYLIKNQIINISRQAVTAHLIRGVEKGYVHKTKNRYRIMKAGQKELLRQMGIGRVLLLVPGKPFSAGMEVGKIFSEMKGTIYICDPYIDTKTLDMIHKYLLEFKGQIKILTSKVIGRSTFRSDLEKIRKEGIDIEVRLFPQEDLHDRYFIDDERFWLSGNSLNFIGAKESFIVMLGDEIRTIMLKTFNSRWQSSSIV